MDVYLEVDFEGIPPEKYSKIKIPKPAFLESAGIAFSHERQEYSADFEFSRFIERGGLEIGFMNKSLLEKVTEDETEKLKEVSRLIIPQFLDYGACDLWKDKSRVGCDLIYFKPRDFKRGIVNFFANNFDNVSANGTIAYLPKFCSGKIMSLGEEYLSHIPKERSMKLKKYCSDLLEDIGFECGDLPVMALLSFMKGFFIRDAKRNNILAQL